MPVVEAGSETGVSSSWCQPVQIQKQSVVLEIGIHPNPRVLGAAVEAHGWIEASFLKITMDREAGDKVVWNATERC